MAGNRVLDPPRNLDPELRLRTQIADLSARVALLERHAPEKLHYVGASGEIPFSGSWVAYNTTTLRPAYYRDRGRTYLSGVVKSGTAGSGAFTLPDGYRPLNADVEFLVVTAAGTGTVFVTSAGVVTCPNSTYTYLDDVQFRSVP